MCTYIDLELASYTFNIIFIIINHKKDVKNEKNIKIIKNNGDKENAIYIILSEKKLKNGNKYELITQPNITNFYFDNNHLSSSNKYMFKYNK